MVTAFFQNSHLESNIEIFYKTGTQRKTDSFSVDGFAVTVTILLKLWFASITFANVRKCKFVLQMKTLWRDKGREKSTNYVDLTCGKIYSIIGMWECQWKIQMRENQEIKSFVTSTFPYRRPLSFENLLSRIQKGKLFGYVQYDLRLPENLREKFESFPAIFKNIPASSSDIGDFMEKYAEENKLMTQNPGIC